MIANDQVDLDELKITGNCLRNYFSQTGNSERKPVEIFIALLDMTIEYIDSGVDSTKMFFDAQEVSSKSCNPKDNYDAAKEFIVRHRKGFDKYIKDNIEEITHFCALNKVKYLPIIKNTDSQGGHKTYFYIGLVPISDSINHEVKLTSNTEKIQRNVSIEYTVPQLPKAATWLKFLLDFKVQGWKFYSYISLPIVAVIISYLLFLWNYISFSTISLTTTIASVSSLVFASFILKPFYSAMKNRIAIAPNWLLKLNVTSAQIRAVKTEHKRANGKYIRALQLVVYKADCPICGNEVSIETGKHAHKGRLIGICDESPREHVFSFDHVTKRGQLLS